MISDENAFEFEIGANPEADDTEEDIEDEN